MFPFLLIMHLLKLTLVGILVLRNLGLSVLIVISWDTLKRNARNWLVTPQITLRNNLNLLLIMLMMLLKAKQTLMIKILLNQCQQLISFLTNKLNNDTHVDAIATNVLGTSLIVESYKIPNCWIIDSRATAHIYSF